MPLNLRWSPSETEIERADNLSWSGWLGKVVRPFTYDMSIRAWVSVTILFALGSVAAVVLAAEATGVGHQHRVELWVVAAVAVGSTLAMGVFMLVASPVVLVRSVVVGPTVFIPLAGILITVVMYATHPTTDVALILYAEQPVFAIYVFRPRLAALLICLDPVLYGTFLASYNDPLWFTKWFAVTSTLIGTGVIVGTIASHGEKLHASEKDARRELASLNSTLEARVAEGVAEVTRLTRLQRFLSPSIADVVASSEHESLLAPHRRKIAVFFCDLRGFTAFTNRAEPEEVLAVLDDYYQVVGRVLTKYGATIGGYAGDGIMAFFGDPVPTPDPAVDAVAMVVALRSAMEPLVRRWEERAYQLGYGVGIAYGHATLGAVGTEGRFDYTPLGSVVNLAARLCAKAAADQALIDRETHLATAGRYRSVNVGAMELKGFGSDVAVYALES